MNGLEFAIAAFAVIAFAGLGPALDDRLARVLARRSPKHAATEQEADQ